MCFVVVVVVVVDQSFLSLLLRKGQWWEKKVGVQHVTLHVTSRHDKTKKYNNVQFTTKNNNKHKRQIATLSFLPYLQHVPSSSKHGSSIKDDQLVCTDVALSCCKQHLFIGQRILKQKRFVSFCALHENQRTLKSE